MVKDENISNKKGEVVSKKNIIVLVVIILILGVIFVFSHHVNSGDDSNTYVRDEITKLMDNYLKIHGESFSISYSNGYFFMNCPNNKSKCDKKDMVKEYADNAGYHEGLDGKIDYEVKISNLVATEDLDVDKFKNPANGRLCFDNLEKNDPIFYLYWDDVKKKFYFYCDLSGNNTSCALTKNNGIVSTLPVGLEKLLKKKKILK